MNLWDNKYFTKILLYRSIFLKYFAIEVFFLLGKVSEIKIGDKNGKRGRISYRKNKVPYQQEA